MQVARVTFMGSPEWNGASERDGISNIDGQTTPKNEHQKTQHEKRKHRTQSGDVYELVTKGKASEESNGARTITGIHPHTTS